MNKIRTPEEVDRLKVALFPVDQAMWNSEQKWGVGRLERLISQSTLEAWRRGWDQYRVALEEGDAEAVEAIGPKMIAALLFMNDEAIEAGHQPLAVDTWETPLGDGSVLVLVRTNAEATAVIRASRGGAFTGIPAGGMIVEPSTETTLPPDLAVTVRGQHEGRRLVVLTMAEIARMFEAQETKLFGTVWQGDATQSGVQLDEMAAADMVRQGYPLPQPLAGSTPSAVRLDF